MEALASVDGDSAGREVQAQRCRRGALNHTALCSPTGLCFAVGAFALSSAPALLTYLFNTDVFLFVYIFFNFSFNDVLFCFLKFSNLYQHMFAVMKPLVWSLYV